MASFSISNEETIISISPVGIFVFLLSRSFTIPLAFITNSRPSFLAAVHKSALISILKASWVNP